MDKTSSLLFRLSFVNEVDGREVTMPINAIDVDPRRYTRMEGERLVKGKREIMLEYVGRLPDMPPSIFKRINALDVTWSTSNEASVDAAAAAAAPAPYVPEDAAVEAAPMDYDPAYDDAAY